MPLNSPILTGDVSGGLHSTQVDKLKAQPLAGTAPTSGQTLTWNGTAWAPATPSTGGGGGANGLTYFLRYDVAPDAPTTNLPGTPKQLGRTGSSVAASVTSGTLANNVWTLLAGFVSESSPQDPATTLIPGGLWDFSVWALGTANIAAPTYIRAKVYTYNNAAAPTLLATSGELPINSVSAKISLSALVPTTVVADTDRIYVQIEARATANNHTATLQFNDGQPSNVATSLPLVGGTGLWKNVSGVLQSPASLLVDADVDPAAAIAQSKISGLTIALAAKAAQAQVDVYATAGTFTWTKPAGAKAVHVALLSGGGGGGSGRKTPSGTAGAGGGGGMGGGYSERVLQADICGATETVTVGAGGAGGAAIVTNGTNGATGIAGGASSFGTFVAAFGGNAGAGGTTSSGGGGAGGNALRAMFPGSAGGAGATAAGAAGSTTGNSASGGGGGGGIAATPAAANGGTGGTSGYFLAGGQASLGIAPGGNGGSNINVPANQAAGGGGGGGGASSITGNAGNGGNGGIYGAGGGGGGAALDGAGNSGAGGTGAQGIVVVTTYF